VRVPAANLVGEENGGFIHLMENLPQERLSIAVGAVAGAESILEQTLEYCRTRTAFGKPIGSFQNSRFVLAELATEVEVSRQYLNRAIEEHIAGRLDATATATCSNTPWPRRTSTSGCKRSMAEPPRS
jgi:alkylation response protein AidB-like acyl-CoA dehydrogenase